MILHWRKCHFGCDFTLCFLSVIRSTISFTHSSHHDIPGLQALRKNRAWNWRLRFLRWGVKIGPPSLRCMWVALTQKNLTYIVDIIIPFLLPPLSQTLLFFLSLLPSLLFLSLLPLYPFFLPSSFLTPFSIPFSFFLLSPTAKLFSGKDMVSDNLEGHDDMVIFLVWWAQIKTDTNIHNEWKRNQPGEVEGEEAEERGDRFCY